MLDLLKDHPKGVCRLPAHLVVEDAAEVQPIRKHLRQKKRKECICARMQCISSIPRNPLKQSCAARMFPLINRWQFGCPSLILKRQVGTPRVNQVDARQIVLHGNLLRTQMLLHGHGVVGATWLVCKPLTSTQVPLSESSGSKTAGPFWIARKVNPALNRLDHFVHSLSLDLTRTQRTNDVVNHPKVGTSRMACRMEVGVVPLPNRNIQELALSMDLTLPKVGAFSAMS